MGIIKKTSYHIKAFILIFVSGVVLFMLSWYAATNGQITGFEEGVFRIFNNAPSVVADIFVVITFFGTITTLLAITAALAIIKKYNWAIQVFLAGSLSWITANIIKLAEIRQRPYDLLSDVHLSEGRDLAAGFPSAHTALITGMVLVLFAKETKKIFWLLGLAIVLVAISRMVVGVHAPLDIIGGLGIGMVVGSLVKLIFLNIKKQKTAR